MPRPYPRDFGAHAIALVREVRQIKQTATALGFAKVILYSREGKVSRAAVLDAWSRKIIGWAIGSKPDSPPVVNALDIALRARTPAPDGMVHNDLGVQFKSRAFTRRFVLQDSYPRSAPSAMHSTTR